MKKALLFVLTLALVISLVPSIGVFAVEEGDGTAANATAINSAAEFAAMDPIGNYYLAADIKIDAIYSGTFLGTLDGKGHTVTVSVPMFQEINATVSNLKIKGAINLDGDNAGALSVDVLGGKYTDITNEATVQASKSAGGLFGWAGKPEAPIEITNFTNKGAIIGEKCGGGAIGNSGKGVAANFTNCHNTAPITGKGDSTGGLFGLIQSSGDYHAKVNFTNCSNSGVIDAVVDTPGGIAGYGQGYAEMKFTNCTNTGDVKRSADGSDYPAGGILGHTSGETYFDNCTNSGNVSNVKFHAGGIVGRIADSGYFTNCTNTGNITSDVTHAGGIAAVIDYDATFDNCFNSGDIKAVKHGGGICAHLGSSDTKNGASYTGCGNTGNITTDKDTAGAIMGYFAGSPNYGATVINCFNTGDINGGLEVAVFVGWFKNSVNVTIENCFTTGKAVTTKDGMQSNALYHSDHTEDVAAANIKNVYYLAGSVDSDHHVGSEYVAPVADRTVSADDVASGKLCYMLNEAAGAEIYFQAIGTDAAPVLTKAADGSNSVIKNADGSFSNPVKAEPTGDAAMIFAFIAVISLFGVATVAKKREN